MRLHVVNHPLVSHKLTVLRDELTDSPTFRRLTDELVTLLAYEATREVRVDPRPITTPVGPTTGVYLAQPKPMVVPILRAGLGMLDPMLATGGTLAAAIRFLTDRGADDITAICLLVAPEGVENLEKALDGLEVPVTVVTAALDEKLN